MSYHREITVDVGEIHLWYVPIKDLYRDLGRYHASLSETERERLERYRFPESQKKYIVSRGVLRDILSGYLAKPPAEIDIANRATGKPHLPHSQLQFNISHSKLCMICAVTQKTPIGVDYQAVYRISNMETLAQAFFSPHEQDIYHSKPASEQREYFFNTWVRKEAFMKATGLGFHLPSNCFSISENSGGTLTLESDNHPEVLDREWFIEDLPVKPGYKGALALRGEKEDLKHFYVA